MKTLPTLLLIKKNKKSSYHISNWKNYNKSLVNRGRITFWIEEECIDEWFDTTGKYTYSDTTIEMILTLKNFYNSKFRQAEGLVISIIELMGLDLPVPDYTTVNRRAKKMNTQF